MRVFVSSVVGGYEEYREAAREAIETLGYVPVVMESTHPSSPVPPREACLTAIGDSEVVVLLLGRRYGEAQKSEKSPTHEEYDHARDLCKHVLVFVEDVDDREDRQKRFIEEIGGWEDGLFRKRYSTPRDLLSEVVGALHKLSVQIASDAPCEADDELERLPPACRRHIESLLKRAVLNAICFRSSWRWMQPTAATTRAPLAF